MALTYAAGAIVSAVVCIPVPAAPRSPWPTSVTTFRTRTLSASPAGVVSTAITPASTAVAPCEPRR